MSTSNSALARTRTRVRLYQLEADIMYSSSNTSPPLRMLTRTRTWWL